MPVDTFRILKGFLAAKKPKWVEPNDVLILAHLLARADAEMKCSVSWATLAECSHIHGTTVYRRALRMEKAGWIVKHSGARRQLGNTYVVQVGNLPLKDFTATALSNEAYTLAAWYHGKVRSHPVHSKRWKRPVTPNIREGWEQRWAFVMQRWLDDGYPAERIKAGLEMCFSVDAQRAVLGPQTAIQQWKKIQTAVENGVTA